MEIPRVSVLVPTYNRVALLERAIRSVLSQSFSDFEIIVINDASTDGTKVFLDGLVKQDPRVKPIHHEKNNYPDISRTLNEGIAHARGNYIARLDDDDYWCDNDKLKEQVAFLEKHPDCAVVGSGMVLVDSEGHEIGRYLKKETDAEIRKTALFANPFSHTTVMFRADIARRVGGYGDWHYAEDWDLWLKMGRVGTLYNFPEYFAAYTVSGENKSFVYLRAQTKTIFKFLKIYKNDYPGYAKAYAVNLMQYYYSFLPVAVRRRLQSVLTNLKRRLF
jgi:glycosyltransferase involved in cell wall biosynthesis